MGEQDFYEKVSNSDKFGFSYISKNLFIIPVKNIGGWKIVNSKTWENLFYSKNKEELYRFFKKYFI